MSASVSLFCVDLMVVFPLYPLLRQDQFHSDKMKTIKLSFLIYRHGDEYLVVGLACFDRAWCLFEAASALMHDNKTSCKKKAILLTEFDGFLKEREYVYTSVKFDADPSFESCNCSFKEDKDFIRGQIVEKFTTVEAFDVEIKVLVQDVLRPFRMQNEGTRAFLGPRQFEYRFTDNCADDHRCMLCNKTREHHHGSDRERYCYDFILDDKNGEQDSAACRDVVPEPDFAAEAKQAQTLALGTEKLTSDDANATISARAVSTLDLRREEAVDAELRTRELEVIQRNAEAERERRETEHVNQTHKKEEDKPVAAYPEAAPHPEMSAAHVDADDSVLEQPTKGRHNEMPILQPVLSSKAKQHMSKRKIVHKVIANRGRMLRKLRWVNNFV